MRKPLHAIALPMVMMAAFIVLGVVLTGLELTSRNVLFVANVHQKNAALAAAEGGIYRAMAELENNGGFSGTLHQDLPGASLDIEVVNQLSGPGYAIVRSTGRAGKFARRVEARLEYSAQSYETIGSEGHIVGKGPSYANGVRSVQNPLAEPAGLHSNSPDPGAISGFSDGDRISATGTVTAVGSVDDSVIAPRSLDNVPRREFLEVRRDELLSGTFTAGDVPADGRITSNLRVSGDLDLDAPLILVGGATLHVEGEAIFHRGVSGSGNVVTDGTMYVRGSSTIDFGNEEGVLLYSEGDLYVVHPEAVENDGEFVSELDPVGDFFARMPEDAPFYMSRRLPTGAPNGVEFFNWYAAQLTARDPSFVQWREGDGSELNPGLPEEVRAWLDSSVSINPQINEWAEGV